MDIFAIDEAREPSRIGSIAIISGALLGGVAIGPALSADLPYDSTPYRQGYYRNSYYPGCYRCSCCGWQSGPVGERNFEEGPPFPVGERPFVARIPMAERHWVQRDYIERRYPYYPGPPYAYPDRYRYSYDYPGSGPGFGAGSGPGFGPGSGPGFGPGSGPGPGPGVDSYNYGQAPFGGRRRFSYGSGQYPPAPAEYRYEAEPRSPYRYAASSRPYEYRPVYENDYRPSYENEASPRPPAILPSGYYNPGYPQ